MLLFFMLILIIAIALTFLLAIPLLIARFLLSLVFLILTVPVVAIVAYWYLGGAALIQELLNHQQEDKQVQHEIEELNNSSEQVIAALKANLKVNANSAQGWYLLGKLYLDQQNYPEAAAALAEANRLESHKPATLLAYAQALFLLSNQQLSPQISQLLTELLQAEPNNLDALNIFALGAYHANEYELAIHYWREILSQLPENSPEYKIIQKAIAKAQEQSAADSNKKPPLKRGC